MPGPGVLARRAGWHVIAVDGSTEDAIQQALDSAGSNAIVVLPAGRYSIARTLEIKGDDVLLVGAGSSVRLGREARDDATVVFRVTDEGEHILPIVRAKGRARVQISGIRFEGISAPSSRGKGVGVLVEDVEDFRIDHSYFSHMGFAGIRVNGESRGVVDHCAFDAEFKPAIGTDGYGVAVYGTETIAGVPFGTADTTMRAVFIEDSSFAECRHAAAANKGGRYVFRHNHVIDGVVAHAVDAHGAEFSSQIGTEWIEVYDNTIEQDHHSAPHYDRWAVRLRGGKGLVWNNTFHGYKVGVELTQQTSEPTGPVFVWGNVIEPPGGVIVRADHGAGPATEGPPAGYHPHAYPHPLASAACAPDGPSLLAGWAHVCVRRY
jgi:hypothetical protein